jgi:serine/threonine protein phosphatase PrpC
MKLVIRFGARKQPQSEKSGPSGPAAAVRTEGTKVIDDTQILVRVGAGGRSECGPVRAINQDCYAIDEGQKAYLVADGMGGHKAGEIASRLATDTFMNFVNRTRVDDRAEWPFGQESGMSFEANRLRNAIALANRRVWRSAQSDPRLEGMGTTMVAVIVIDDTIAIGHVGDSRLYHCTPQAIEQVTLDDSWAVHAPDHQPRDADGRVRPGVLTSVLGMAEPITVHVTERKWDVNDVLVLCSDGLHGVVDAESIEQVLHETQSDPDLAARKLVDIALARGTRDNVTAVVVRRER